MSVTEKDIMRLFGDFCDVESPDCNTRYPEAQKGSSVRLTGELQIVYSMQCFARLMSVLRPRKSGFSKFFRAAKAAKLIIGGER